MTSTIGIKIANGEFYPIIGENSEEKKRLVLTTVHDRQLSVQIDLYKSQTRTMGDAVSIGSLVIENIKSRPKGEPSIELIISSNSNGDIIAEAVDLDSSAKGRERQILSVSLKSLEESLNDEEIPDFLLESSKQPPVGLYNQPPEKYKEGKKRSRWGLILLLVLVLLCIAAAIWFFFFRDGGRFAPGQAVRTELPAQPAPVQQEPEAVPQPPPSLPAPAAPPVQPATQSPQAAVQPPPAAPLPVTAPPPQVATQPPPAPPPVIQAPAQPPAPVAQVSRQRPSAPVASFDVPAVIPREGFPYRVRYGDTLWDISLAFYRTPWLYPRIAQFNNIRNPNLIIAGSVIRVPPRN